MDTTHKQAVIVIDFINEIVDPKGKLAGKGYAAYDAANGTLENVARLIAMARIAKIPIIYVRVGFSQNYAEHPEKSPLFGAARKFGALQLGTNATEFHAKIAPEKEDIIINKHRVSAFFGTSLEAILRNLGISNVIIVGVATDLAVQAAARDAHDRDFMVTIVTDCCVAANDEDHQSSVKLLGKIARTVVLKDLLMSKE